MSLFQCQNCGCVENTATSHQGFVLVDCYDWTGIEDRKGKQLCSACGPGRFTDGQTFKYMGKWHDKFRRIFLPMGMFHTNRRGNLAHVKTGEEDYLKYEIQPPEEA